MIPYIAQISMFHQLLGVTVTVLECLLMAGFPGYAMDGLKRRQIGCQPIKGLTKSLGARLVEPVYSRW